MPLLELIEVGIRFSPGQLAQQLFQEGFATHANAAMDFPLRDYDLCRTQSFGPGSDVLIITIDQSAIQIEQ
jgi:hypothetical protein